MEEQHPIIISSMRVRYVCKPGSFAINLRVISVFSPQFFYSVASASTQLSRSYVRYFLLLSLYLCSLYASNIKSTVSK